MTSNDIRDSIAELTLELNRFKQDAATAERLQNAVTEVRRLTPILDKLTSDLNDTLAVEAKFAEEQFKNSVRNVRVVYQPGKGGILTGVFKISYQVWATNQRTYELEWQERAAKGFGGLDPRVLRWMLTYSPQSFPKEIMALAPNDPEAALTRYWQGVSRGYLQG